MLLAIDIGNTNITAGVWNGHAWQHQWRLQTVRQRTADEYGIVLSSLLREAKVAGAIDGFIISSVVPMLSKPFTELGRVYLGLEPRFVTHAADTGVRILTEDPAEVGADRIVNAAAAYDQFRGPCLVIDMGTATTFDVISRDGDLLGVAIAPGLRLAADALAEQAAQLSHVPLEAPPQATGRNTMRAMQSGLIFGYVGLIEGMIQRLLLEHPDRDEQIHTIGTGGLVNLITPHTGLIAHIEPALTLNGLRVIASRLAW